MDDDHELARLIDTDPDNVDAYRVYADWLADRGDPRSELIAMQILHERITDRTKLEHFEPRLTALFEQHRAHLLGGLAKLVPKSTASKATRERARQRFTWRYGFIHTARLTRQFTPPMDAIVELLLTHPSGRFVVELSLDSPETGSPAAAVLARLAPASLRALELVYPSADLGALWPAVPRLRSITIVGPEQLGEIDLPVAQIARFTAIGSASAMHDLRNARMPRVETLELDTRFDPSVDDVIAILRRDDLPQLRTLALGYGPINELLRALVGLPIARQLVALDLSESYMLDDSGASALAQLTGLETLELHPRCRLTADGWARLATVARSVLEVQPAR